MTDLLDLMASKSYINCHAKGVDSVVLGMIGMQMKRAFIAHEHHELWKNEIKNISGPPAHIFSVGLHAHHCDVDLVPLIGNPWNVWGRFSRKGTPLTAFEYHSPIREGGVGKFERLPFPYSRFILRMSPILSHLELVAHELHTIFVPKDQPAAWMVYEGTEDPHYDPLTFSNADLELADFSELYKPMDRNYLKKLLDLIGWERPHGI